MAIVTISPSTSANTSLERLISLQQRSVDAGMEQKVDVKLGIDIYKELQIAKRELGIRDNSLPLSVDTSVLEKYRDTLQVIYINCKLSQPEASAIMNFLAVLGPKEARTFFQQVQQARSS